MIPDETALLNWTAFLYFQKGTTLLYAGQEVCAAHCPGLFDKDTVEWDTGKDLSALLRALGEIKKHPLLTDSRYEVRAMPREILYASHRAGERQLTGVFSLRGERAPVPVEVPDGRYRNLIDGGGIEVRAGKLSCQGTPVIFESAR